MLRPISFATSILLLSATSTSARPTHFTASHVSRQTNNSAASFDWFSLTPDDTLKTTVPCFTEPFRCARLNVPLDYSRPQDSPKAILPILTLPAADRANRKGSVIFNPGGPGNSGTWALLQLAEVLAQIVGPAYDVVGFDPRGTGSSIPSAQCFTPSDWADLQKASVLAIDSDDELKAALQNAKMIAEGCATVLGGTGNETTGGSVEEWGGGRFMDAGSTASDILSISRALGDEKVNYIGLSYGSYLGQVLAAMHPNGIGLLYLDGIIDGERWRKAEIQEMLRDADLVALSFAYLCAEAGPEACPLAAPNLDAQGVGARILNITAGLDSRPLEVPERQLNLTSDIVRAVLGRQLSFPLQGLPVAAQLFSAIEQRNTTAVAALLPPPSPLTGLESWLAGDAAEAAITCTDFPDLTDWNFDQAAAAVQNATKISAVLGPVMIKVGLQCIPWSIRPKNPYTGPMSASNTSGKILFVNNEVDPTTPLAAALAVQPRYANSVLLVQKTIGHTALMNAGSCLVKTAGAFFQTGTLPEQHTICLPDQLPIVGKVDENLNPVS